MKKVYSEFEMIVIDDMIIENLNPNDNHDVKLFWETRLPKERKKEDAC